MILRLGHLALEPLEVRNHRSHRHLVKCTLDIVLDDFDVVRWHVAAESGTDTFRAVHQNHRHNRGVKLRLHLLTVIHHVFQNRIVRWIEDLARLWTQPREDVTGAGRILATRQPRPKLSRGLEEVEVVGAHEILSQIHDRAL